MTRGGLLGALVAAFVLVAVAPLAQADGGALVCDGNGVCQVVATTTTEPPAVFRTVER